MGWFRKRGRSKHKGASDEVPTANFAGLSPTVQIDLSALQARLAERLPHVVEQPVDPMLVHARLADAYRDEDHAPMPSDAFLDKAKQLSDEAWRRLTLLVDLLELPEFREGLAELLDEEGATPQVKDAFLAFAADTKLLTIDTLRHSDLRREELLRRFIVRLGAGIEGETVEDSLQRLGRLDYGKLLGEAERARKIAEDRMAYLQKLQGEQDRSRQRYRGKW